MIATGTDPGHFITSQECDTCHTNNFWIPLVFDHLSANYPGDHSSPLDCEDCHGGNSEQVTWEMPQFVPNCAACHFSDYEEDEHDKVEDLNLFYPVEELQDCTGACHTYTDATFQTIDEFNPGPEHRVTDSDFN